MEYLKICKTSELVLDKIIQFGGYFLWIEDFGVGVVYNTETVKTSKQKKVDCGVDMSYLNNLRPNEPPVRRK